MEKQAGGRNYLDQLSPSPSLSTLLQSFVHRITGATKPKLEAVE
jgi:hypothetical protein